jgi:hypothetical protein
MKNLVNKLFPNPTLSIIIFGTIIAVYLLLKVAFGVIL